MDGELLGVHARARARGFAPGESPAFAFGAFTTADHRADADALAYLQTRDALAQFDDCADRFMPAVAAGHACAAIGFHLAAADGGAGGFDDDFAGRGLGRVGVDDAGSGAAGHFEEFHGIFVLRYRGR